MMIFEPLECLVLPINGFLCTKFWKPTLEFENELDIIILYSQSESIIFPAKH